MATVEIRDPSGNLVASYQSDLITVRVAASSPPPSPPPPPPPPTGTKDAVVAWLASLPATGQAVVGQYLGWHGGGGASATAGLTELRSWLQGEPYPGLIGVSFVSAAGSSLGWDTEVVAIEQYTSVAGRRPLVFVSGHFPNPQIGTDFAPPFSGDPWTYSSWRRTLDVFSAGLQQLLALGYVILWRPFPEVNNPGFWWSQPAVKDWWARLHHDFTARGLTDLIWVYNCMATVGGSQRYPGATVVDMVGPTVYRGSTQWGRVIPVTPELVALNKPYCFAEVGPSDPPDGSLDCRRVLDSISYQPLSWMMFWNEGWSLMRNRYGRELLRDPRVVTISGLP